MLISRIIPRFLSVTPSRETPFREARPTDGFVTILKPDLCTLFTSTEGCHSLRVTSRPRIGQKRERSFAPCVPIEVERVDPLNRPRYRGVMDYTKRITIEPDKRSGQPCIRGLRMTVKDVLEYLDGGMTAEESTTGCSLSYATTAWTSRGRIF